MNDRKPRRYFHRNRDTTGEDDPGLPVYQKGSAKIQDSASYLADHLGEVPVHIIPCVECRFENYTGTEFKPGPRILARARTYWDVWGERR